MDERKRREREEDLIAMANAKALYRIPIEPPQEIPSEEPETDFYCTKCDSSYCTCKKETL